MEIDIREHGGNFGGGGSKQLFGGIAIKQMFRPSFVTGSGSPSTIGFAETLNYFWMLHDNGGFRYLVQIPKKKSSDVKIMNLGSMSTNTGIMALYSLDKIVMTVSSAMYIVSSALTYDYQAALFATYPISGIRAYYYNSTTKILYMVYENSVTNRRIQAINLTTISAPAIVYNILLYNSAESVSYTYACFEPENSAVRIYHPNTALHNSRYNLSNGSLIASYGTNAANPNLMNIAIDKSDYSKMVMIDSSGAKKVDINTNVVVTSSTAANMRTQIAALMPSISLTLDNFPYSFCRKLPNGNYLGFIGAKLSTGTNPPSSVLAFVIDTSLNVVSVEFSQDSEFASQATSSGDMNCYENWLWKGNPAYLWFLKI